MEKEEPTGTTAAGPRSREWVVPLVNGLTLVSVGGMAIGAMVLAFDLLLKLIDRGVRIDLAIGIMALGLLTFVLALFMLSRKLPVFRPAPAPPEGAGRAQAALPEQARTQLDAAREPAHSVTDYTTRSLEHTRAGRETV
jgi:hypothetical protein